MATGVRSTGDEVILQSARAGEPDRYLAALLAPLPARLHLLALAAFSSELAHVSAAVTREPAMGEIRLQWWRDSLAPDAVPTGNPIADALHTAIAEASLPRPVLLEVIDAHALDLSPQPLESDADLDDYLQRTEGALFGLAARILDDRRGGAPHATALAAGRVYGLARVLLGLPHALSRGRQPLPRARIEAAGLSRDVLLAGEGGDRIAGLLDALHAEARAELAEARGHVANLPRELRLAFLPLALVETYLRALERPGRDVLRAPAGIAPLTRVFKIAAAHWLGRL